MDTPIHAAPTRLAARLRRHLGRHAEKSFDWDAFPSNRGFPELARAQMRYIGAGGSPKTGDAATLPPGHFTLSLLHQPVGNYAACHAHETEESFLVLAGVLTVGWERDGDVVEVRLGPRDMILNARDIGHGFRNDGIEPVLMSISVDAGRPLPPRYLYHPRDTDAALARRFGAAEGRTLPCDPDGAHPLQTLMARHVVRRAELPAQHGPAGITRKVYVGSGGIGAEASRRELLVVPPAAAVAADACDGEEALLVLAGALTVGWEEDGDRAEITLGPRDLLLTPPRTRRWFRNDDAVPAEVWCVIGVHLPDAGRPR